MADSCSDSDSEGEEKGMIRPGLIRELKNVLAEYPDDGQIIKEMIQNAEDAGARCVQILTDRRHFHGDLDKKTRRKHPHLVFLQAPSLCVYNDAKFTDCDWDGIRMLHTSVKEKDPLKVGRFGLGFKSVFHLADRLVIISGHYVMYMDPFKGEERCCSTKELAKLRGRELASVLHCIEGVFGVTQEKIRDGHFPGTLFWFPLRQTLSDLSPTVYTQDKVGDLVNAFKAEAHSILLFLKNIERINVFSRDNSQSQEEVFTVEIAASCLEEVRAERKKFIKALHDASGELPSKGVNCVTEMMIETSDHLAPSHNRNHWLVVGYHPGQGEVSQELARLCADPELSYRPHVGMAIPLDEQAGFQSQLFCFLPLPLHTRSPTGLPLHVNGYFALSQNRRHLKWPTEDQMRNQAQLEASVRWNCLLVKELIPRVYTQLLERLKSLHWENPDVFYSAWPDIDEVDDMWRPLIDPFFHAVVAKNFFHTQARGGDWIPLRQAVLQTFSPAVTSDVERAVVTVYVKNSQNLVKLPDHVHGRLQQIGLLHKVPVISPERTRQLLPNCLTRLSRSEKLHVLHYLSGCDATSAADLLRNLPLLPLADKTFGMFGSSPVTYWCEPRLQQLFRGLEHKFCSCHDDPSGIRDRLRKLAQSGQLALRMLGASDPAVISLLGESLQSQFGSQQPSLSPHDPWVEQVWQFLSSTEPWLRDLRRLSHLPLLPCQTGDTLTLCPLNGLYICSSACGMKPLNATLAASLRRLLITVLQQFPTYITHQRVLGELVQYPSPEGVLAVLQKLNKTSQRGAAVRAFNENASANEKKAVVDFLADATSSLKEAVDLLCELNLFPLKDGASVVSVNEVQDIGPDCTLPVESPSPLLSCNETSKRAALKLGAQQKTLKQVVGDMLELSYQYSDTDKVKVMKFFLSRRDLVDDQSLLSVARQVKFLSTRSGQLMAADNLYDPSCQVLVEVFHAEDRFPCGEFANQDMLKKLRKLGLRTEKAMRPDDLLQTASSIKESIANGDMSLAERKAQGLLKFLVSYGDTIQCDTLRRMSQIQCLPCLQPDSKPGDYPSSLFIKSEPVIVRPVDMTRAQHIRLVGSVVPLAKPDLPRALTDRLQICDEPKQWDVIHHLLTVVSSFAVKEIAKYRLILSEMFLFLNKNRSDWIKQTLQQTECVLVESGECFARPDKFWVQTQKSDIELKPYRFHLPKELTQAKDLIMECGAHQHQDPQLLIGVLEEIRDNHDALAPNELTFQKDLQLVKQILDILKTCESIPKGTVLIPVEHAEQFVIKFKEANQCTIRHGPWQVNALAEEEEMFFVHQDIHSSTAKALGALDLKERALTGVEDLDFGYSQHEELTTRLHNLLNDSYTDGFSVPKELIQNADDAGASEVRFLLDERENQDARSNLISDNMASLQGPAIWAYNNAVFTDADFENIVKLGKGTKEEDAAKVGRFGLGFNSVYNLTDVPSFISRHTMAMFDPHVKYLCGGPGLKLDFRRQVNHSLLTRMPNQFKPFQGVFGCTLQNVDEVSFQGTLFRFPLRTADQADESKIKAESYSQAKRREFLRMLLERAGSLLMFTQNVTKVQVYHLPSHCVDPHEEANCVLTVTRTTHSRALLTPAVPLEGTVLQYCTINWPTNTNIKILEDVGIKMEVTNSAQTVCQVNQVQVQTRWKLAWCSGSEDSLKAMQRQKRKGFVPLAAVGISLSDNSIQRLADCDIGFYTSGRLFCFMPLPKEMVKITLPVHINGTFDLTSSRRSLKVQTEDDISLTESDWNAVLFGDAVCRAYLLLLENIHEEATPDKDYQRYFDLWPDTGETNVDRHFYRRLVSDENKVLPVPSQSQWVSFQDAWFLDPDFRESACGQLAWDALNHFWERRGSLVYTPSRICRLLKTKGQQDAFLERVITQQEFYKKFFFPNIDSSYWNPADRNKLVHNALMQNDPTIQDLLGEYNCIPCQDTGKLRRPADLIHPSGAVSKLYRPSEGRFPQNAGSGQINFCSYDCLRRLQKLEMVVDDMSIEMVLERSKSISILLAEDCEAALKRAGNLIEYLASAKGATFRFDIYSPNKRGLLSDIAWLPVLRKPEDWPFPWKGNEGPVLVTPKELFANSLREIAACNVKLLDSEKLGVSGSLFIGKKKEVLESFGVKVREDYKDCRMRETAIQQLLSVVHQQEHDPSPSRDKVQQVCNATYKFLDKCIRQSEDNSTDEISARLRKEKVIWVGDCFVSSSQVAFNNRIDCHPHLFRLESSLQVFKALFKKIGVKEKFDRRDAVSVLENIHANNTDVLGGDTIKLVSQVAQLLCDIMTSAKESELPRDETVYLPDRRGHMMSTKHLCLDDCPWLKESETMHFVHDAISPETARMLGVETKRGKDFDDLMKPIPFGQHEKLTTRIKRLLEGYTFDSSLFKELLQNADDAGATEIKFILDDRSLSTEKVPEGWSDHLQGPAVCVYNNKSFTSKDMQGIQNLGEGSKGEDLLKTGQYGVGFNAVYHITDVPSFWTLENDAEEAICVFDPNCRYVRNTLPNQPGVRLGNVSRVREAYPDMFAGYLENCIDMSQSGTMFRFPLRTQAMAEMSALKQPAVTCIKMKELLQQFGNEAKSCLLFLNNLQKIGIYHVADSQLVLEFEAEKNVQDACLEHNKQFNDKLCEASASIEDVKKTLTDIPEFEAVVRLTLTDSTNEEEWLTVNRVGFADRSKLSEKLLNEWKQKHFRLLPRGGVAVRLSQKERTKDHMSFLNSENHHAFCILPLPSVTGLPLHINGHFILDHETRRNLWDNMGDTKTEWNMAIARQVIVPAYVTCIQSVKHSWFKMVAESEENLASKLFAYHDLFPALDKIQTLWKGLAEEFYRKVADLHVFPVTNVDGQGISWAPAVRQEGFPGYFDNLVCFFLESPNRSASSRPVVLSQGCSSQAYSSGSRDTWAKKRADSLACLLKKLNMGVLNTPFRVFEALKKSNVQGMQEITPVTVVHFLKSAGSEGNNGCCIKDLPQHISKTPFQTVQNVELLLEFVKNDTQFLDKLDGLPLSLRQSEDLFFFQEMKDDEKPIVSRFCCLLPGSAKAFLGKTVYRHFKVLDNTQSMLREFDIPVLACMLRESLKESEFKTGEQCSLTTAKLPDLSWLRDLWEFIQTRLKRHSTDETDIVAARVKMEKELDCLADWSLIPVKKKAGGEEKALLYPIRYMHQVLHLSGKSEQANQKLLGILKNLPLAFLDIDLLPIQSVLVQTVASIGHPRALLHALASCREALTVPPKDAYAILVYFSDNLKVLQESCDTMTMLKQELKSLPLFLAIDESLMHLSGNTPILCLTSRVRHEGLTEWSQRRGDILLVRQKGVPDELRDFLEFKKVPDEDFYRIYLLPMLYALPLESVIIQITAIRNVWDKMAEEERASLTNQLKCTAFIERDGVLFKASKFYSPFKNIFKAMCPPGSFPPKPFCDLDWELFMISVGMISTVTDEMFIKYAHIIENEGELGLSKSVKEKSDMLVNNLLNRQNLFECSLQQSNAEEEEEECCLLRQVQKIAFVRPYEWNTEPAGELLRKIAKPFSENRLVALCNGCHKDDLHLVWSSSSILHPRADHSLCLKHKLNKKILQHFPFLGDAPKQKVFIHLTTICRALAEPEGQKLFASMKESDISSLETVMDNLYSYLRHKTEEWELAEIKDLPVICNLKKRTMLRAENVILDLRDEEAIDGHLQKAPTEFGRYFDLFKKLGVAEHVTANHYAKVLLSLKAKTEEKSLHVEEMKVVKQAIRGMFRCLKSQNTQEKTLDICKVYLPSEDECLEASCELTFKDKVILGERLQHAPPDMHFFLGFKALEIKVMTPYEEVNLLPKQYRMKLLSDTVKEVITERSKITANDGAHSRHFADKVFHPKCVAAIVRLSYHQHRQLERECAFTEETANGITTAYHSISIKETKNLQTVLEINGTLVKETERRKPSYTDKDKSVPRSCTVYLDSDSCGDMNMMMRAFFHSFALAVQFMLEYKLDNYLLHRVLESPSQAEGILDMNDIYKCDFKDAIERSVFPSAGTFIRTEHHCYLDNNFDQFYEGEHVGFEVYDPAWDSQDPDEDPVYIYAIIIEEMKDESHDDIPFLARKYRIDLGPDRGKAVVSVTQLYKFIRKARQGKSKTVAKYDGPQDAIEDFPSDLTAVLREIRKTLNNAWQLLDESGQRRVVKRLYLKWHPDKNPGKEEFCTRVVQAIQRYVDLLRQGKMLPEDEDDVSVSSGSYKFSSSAYSSFFERMHRRGRSYREHFDSDTSYGARQRGGGRYSNPQPGEGRRWFRQAEADLSAAQASRGSCLMGNNWICYKCHQAVEKALKSILYRRDSDDYYCLHSHELPTLANMVGDSELEQLARDLECRIGPHTRMRYPDVLQYPCIPSDVFTDDDASFACDIAARVISRVQCL